MTLKKIIVAALIMCICIQDVESVECTPNFCKTRQCKSVTCGPHQLLRRRADVCGCCDVCTELLEMGMPCISFRGPPATAQCGRYLVCMHRRCVPMYRMNKNRR
ncbi:hypothetical protein TNCT_54721 [Trichonephila clavata]|uniref:Uncharacterized protein n=1 Tax=Trichonephila clavata TaxID=2740835 RepID=A0A8X6KSU6_TRICU|nr:hypothetical protein TNCT_54721 [Trichonephila clavata]